MDNQRVKRVTYTALSQFWGKLERVDFDYKFKKGGWKRLSHEAYGKNDGVAILLYNSQTKNVILCKQFRIPVYMAGVFNGYSIEVCGGALDKGETPENCVKREVQEELGYKVSNIKTIGAVFLSPGIVKERVHLFIAEYTELDKIKNRGGGLEAENEEIEVLEIPFNNAMDMIVDDKIIDARTIMLLQHVKLIGAL